MDAALGEWAALFIGEDESIGELARAAFLQRREACFGHWHRDGQLRLLHDDVYPPLLEIDGAPGEAEKIALPQSGLDSNEEEGLQEMDARESSPAASPSGRTPVRIGAPNVRR